MLIFPSLANAVIFLSAAAVSTTATFLILRGRPLIGIDAPDFRRKLHSTPISRLGGLPIFFTLVAGLVAARLTQPDFPSHWWPVAVSNLLVFLIGFLDDLRPLGAKFKLVGQIGAASVLYATGVSIDELSNPFRSGSFIDLGVWGFPITVAWLIALPNIINLIDGMDGLATGFGLFLCLTLAFVGHFNLKPDVVFLSVVMSGALAGFLVFNYPPAKIFLGDGGAYLIGFFIASASLVSSQKGSVMAALLVIVAVLGVPILDTLFAIIRRAMRGVPIFQADAEHIHHRLVLLGFSKTRALIAIYSVTLVLSMIGIAIFIRRGFQVAITGTVLFLLAMLAARYLGYVKSWKGFHLQLSSAQQRRKEMLFAGLCAKMAEWEVERSNTGLEFVAQLSQLLQRLDLSIRPLGNFHGSIRLKLSDGIIWCLYHSSHDLIEGERHLSKADLFGHSIVCALERWGELPGLELDFANQKS